MYTGIREDGDRLDNRTAGVSLGVRPPRPTFVTTGAYPGTFNPPTIAHLAIAEAARQQGALDRLDLVVSRDPLGKEPTGPPLEVRLQVLETLGSTRPWLGVRVTDSRLITDVAAGYDAVVVGVDKWLQIADPAWYEGSTSARDAAVAGLPRILLAARPPLSLPAELPAGALVLALGVECEGVSSSAVRAGRQDWMVAEAAAHDRLTGAWSREPGAGGSPDSGEQRD